MVEEGVAERDELSEPGRGGEGRFDHLGVEDPPGFVHGGELEVLLRTEVGVDTALAHAEASGEVADRQAFEAVDRRERHRFAHDRLAGAFSVGTRLPRIGHVDKIARSVVLYLEHERSCFLVAGGPAAASYGERLRGGAMVVDLEHDEDLALDRGGVATPAPTTEVAVRGVRIDVVELCRRVRVRHRGVLTLLDSASFTVAAGELVAIIGPSGAGKTTVLEAIAGIGPTTSGSVRFDGVDLHANLGTFRSVLGYVPQEDIVHAELPLRRMLRYAARLRLPSSTRATEVDRTVTDAIDAVGLTGQGDVRVGSLSGGQRKRASIAVELLTDPHVFFLDEPTSGLDPITGAELVSRLRDLADRSATVVFTTHSVEDLAQCDRIVCMAPGGRLAFVGPVADALEHFGVRSVTDLYRALAAHDATADVVHASVDVARPGPGRAAETHATGCERVDTVGGAHPPDAGDVGAQPLDARDPGRLAGTGRGDVRGALPAGRVRPPAPESQLDGDDRLLDRVCRLLLRAHVRPAADLHRTDDPAA